MSLRFPMFIDLQGKPCLVVGHGTVGIRRCRVLREFGADVLVIAPDCGDIPDGVRALRREYRAGDAEGMALVVAATSDRAVNSAVADECHRLGIMVSVADDPSACSFFFPAICRTERLTAGLVSTDGDHALVARAAKSIREKMEESDS